MPRCVHLTRASSPWKHRKHAEVSMECEHGLKRISNVKFVLMYNISTDCDVTCVTATLYYKVVCAFDIRP